MLKRASVLYRALASFAEEEYTFRLRKNESTGNPYGGYFAKNSQFIYLQIQ
jgi:hypothetical protein